MKKGKYINRGRPGFRLLALGFAALFLFAGYKRISIAIQRAQSSAYAARLVSRAVVAEVSPPRTDDTISLSGETRGGEAEAVPQPGEEAPVSTEPEAPCQEEAAPIRVDFAYLQEQIPDIRGWVYCPDTPVNYPVVQGTDNQYYVNHLADGTPNASGAIFLDYRNGGDLSDRITVVYGHNMRNGSMFTTVQNYNDQAFYEEHPVWYWITPDRSYRVELLAGYVAPAKSAVYGIITGEEERNALLTQAVAESRFCSRITEEEGRPLIAFSTCTYEYEDSRFILLGRLIEIASTN